MNEIKDYFIIGDLHSTALVSKEASIDWLCWPDFDSPSIFAKLLDDQAGSFSVGTEGFRVESRYVKETAIVEYIFKNNFTEFSLHDFMVHQPQKVSPVRRLVRKFKGVKGKSKIKLYFSPKINYGQDELSTNSPLVTAADSTGENLSSEPKIILEVNKTEAVLFAPKAAIVDLKGSYYQIEFDIDEGVTQSVVFQYGQGSSKELYEDEDLEIETESFWKMWVAKGTFFDLYREHLIRSAITLKLMQFYPTGALVAAPTTSLPEEIGGVRNWDYRYVWIRDATFTLYAFLVLGYTEEAEKFFNFIHGIVEKCQSVDFDISLVYTITGGSVPHEQVLKHFRGYKNSRPVRIGNGARNQFQLDVYGALIDSYYFISKRKTEISKVHKDLIMNLLNKISEVWAQKDSGIWEVRSGPQHFAYSKVMAWVGVNRTLRMSKQLGLREGEIRFCQVLEKQISSWIWDNCYDKKRQVFRQYPLTRDQDATTFLFVLLQFLNKHDPKTYTIIENTCKALCVKNVFVYRYFADDGLPQGEGVFLLCTFWLISAFAILEDTKTATKLFSEFEKYMSKNHLLSEEIDHNTGEYLGNYPQAFPHQGFIMTAYYINRYQKKG